MSTNPLKECKRCNTVHRQKDFNPAFDCCKTCVTTADLDNLQPEITQIMRGFSAQEKSEIMREAFRAHRQKKNEAIYGQEDKVRAQADGQKARQACGY